MWTPEVCKPGVKQSSQKASKTKRGVFWSVWQFERKTSTHLYNSQFWSSLCNRSSIYRYNWMRRNAKNILHLDVFLYFLCSWGFFAQRIRTYKERSGNKELDAGVHMFLIIKEKKRRGEEGIYHKSSSYILYRRPLQALVFIFYQDDFFEGNIQAFHKKPRTRHGQLPFKFRGDDLQ